MKGWRVWCPVCGEILSFTDNLRVAKAKARNHSAETGHSAKVIFAKGVRN